jgi:kynurenine formamidase
VKELLDRIRASKVYDLAQPYFVGMPHYPSHPPFLFGLTKKHGDLVLEGGVSSSADSIALGTHVGTHIDALCHFSCGGKLYGGMNADAVQSDAGGIREHSVDTVEPILRRGVLLDIASFAKTDALPTDFSIMPDHLEAAVRAQRVEIQRGDVVLLRTGWARFWNDPVRYIAGGSGSVPSGPGPELESARWLSRHGIFAAGSDTVAFEKVPAASMPVHVHLLVESGIYIIEALNLEELARDRVYEFVFVATPLKIRGATGSPIRPIALVN